MRRLLMILVTTLVATAAIAHEWGEGGNCTSRNFGFDGRRAVVREETIEAASLRTVAVRNAPVSITGGNTRGYTITVCKAAVSEADLAAIQVAVEGGALVTRGPADTDDWNVTYRIAAPNGSTLDVETRNGPLSIKDLDATLNVRLKNGPLSLRNVGGTVDAEAENGPISIKGGSGTMRVSAANGPISVTLDGDSWQGGGLEASTTNGPLTVKVPKSFNSGVVVEAEGRGPISCRAEACQGQSVPRARDWDDDRPRKFELGRGPQVVRLSTVNGPLTIKDAE